MATYRINYSKTIEQANDIYDLSQDLGQEISKLENLLTQVKNNWSGPASDAYQKQLLMLIADMKTTKHSMSSLSTTIKNAARKIRDEDNERNEDD